MLADRLTSPRARAAALAVAFSVVAGGVAIATLPQIAAAVEDGSVSASTSAGTIAPDAASVPFTASGFTPGNVVYLQVTSPDGVTNWSWGSTSFTVSEDGTVSGELPRLGDWQPGAYKVTVHEREGLEGSFSFDVKGEGGTPTESAEPTATETATAEPTATESAEPTATATETTEPTATETADPTATATETSEPTATATETAEPTATETVAPTAEPTVTEEPQPTITLGTPQAWAEQSVYTPAEASASGVAYSLAGFTPGVELELVLTLPNGDEAVFSSLEPITPDGNGEYSGVITYSGEWPQGDYGVTVRTIEGQMLPVDIVLPGKGEAGPAETPAAAEPAAEAETDQAAADAAAADEAAPASAAPVAAAAAADVHDVAGAPAPIQEASFSFAVEPAAAPGGNGTGSGSTTAAPGGTGVAGDGSLASTGAEGVFGAAGLGLLLLGAGAAAIAGARFLGRRRDA